MTTTRRYLRFLVSDRLLHLLLLISFTMLALTGLPQKYANERWGILTIQAMGGIEQVRVFHHTFAVILILVSIGHAVQLGYRVYVERAQLSMIPTLKDVTDFVDSIKFNLGLSKDKPNYPRFNFMEKLEYWAVVWGTILMTLTGYVLWNPILVTRYLPGEFVPASKIAHGMEAVLAVLSILTWHFYFVHIRFNKSIFNGYLSEEHMEEEHGAELEQRIKGEVRRPPSPEVRYRRLRLYAPLAAMFAIVSVLGTWRWLTAETTAITTVPRVVAEEKVYQPVALEPLPLAETPSPVPTPLSVLLFSEAAPAAPPAVPHSIEGDRAQCTVCHAPDSMIRPAPSDHEGRTDDQCATCHQPAEGGAP
jgi:cytochrome b subunit of formate dehydrogenase